jgi:tagatose 6-phosphate kinase
MEENMILTVTLNAAIDKRYVVADARIGEVNRVLSCSYTAGGKGINVSRAAAIAGAKVIATGFVGGHAGQFIIDQLEAQRISTDFLHLSGESRSCINLWDSVNKVQTEYLEPGFTVTEEEFQLFLNKYMKLVEASEVVAISGSLPKGLDGTAYQKLVTIGKELGKKVILDTSGEALRLGIEAKPTMIKPNIDEIRMLTGKSCESREELLEAAASIHHQGVDLVAISLGADGSLVVCSEGSYQAKVPRIEAVNTVGCGDTMIAGFALGLEQGLGIEETLQTASAIASAAALREETGFFVMDDMIRLKEQIEVVKL